MIGSELVCFCLLLVVGIWADRKMPSYVQICKRFDPNLSECWKNSVLGLRPHLAKGIPEFDIPPMEAFVLEKARLDRSHAQSLNLLVDLYNLTIHGLTDFDLPFVKVDSKDNTLEVDIFFPDVKIDAKYKATGKILTFDIEGEGEAEVEFVGGTHHCNWYFKMQQKNGKDHLKIEKSEIHSQIQTTRVNFHDLFKGHPEVTENVNMVINDNMDILYQDIRPLVEEIILSLFSKHAQRVLDLYPADVLYPID